MYANRMIPQFLIIGVQKGGTSSLFYYLKSHPQIKRSITKEIHYFNLFYENGLKWYLGHFPAKSDKYITGEATPDYIFHIEAAKRIKALNPNMKIIVLLRNPIERAYSAYQMNRRRGLDNRETFQDAIDFECNYQTNISNDYSYDRDNFFYLQRGKYAAQLSLWDEYFSKPNLLVLNSHYFFQNINETVSQVQAFLGLKIIKPKSIKPMNVGTYPPLSEEHKRYLTNYFQEDLNNLKENWNIEFNSI